MCLLLTMLILILKNKANNNVSMQKHLVRL